LSVHKKLELHQRCADAFHIPHGTVDADFISVAGASITYPFRRDPAE
jgi:hypothetical protein